MRTAHDQIVQALANTTNDNKISALLEACNNLVQGNPNLLKCTNVYEAYFAANLEPYLDQDRINVFLGENISIDEALEELRVKEEDKQNVKKELEDLYDATNVEPWKKFTYNFKRHEGRLTSYFEDLCWEASDHLDFDAALRSIYWEWEHFEKLNQAYFAITNTNLNFNRERPKKKYMVKSVPLSVEADYLVEAYDPEDALIRITNSEGQRIHGEEKRRDLFKILRDKIEEHGIDFIAKTTVQDYE